MRVGAWFAESGGTSAPTTAGSTPCSMIASPQPTNSAAAAGSSSDTCRVYQSTRTVLASYPRASTETCLNVLAAVARKNEVTKHYPRGADIRNSSTD